MIRPTRAEFRKLALPGKRVPVVREILADTETPVSAFLKLTDGGDAFLLESVEGGERWSRYSILGATPQAVLEVCGDQTKVTVAGRTKIVATGKDSLAELRRWQKNQKPVTWEGLPPFWGGAVGFLSYDIVRTFENIGVHADLGDETPEALFLFVDQVVVFDNLSLTMKIVSSRPAGKDPDATYDACVREVNDLARRLKRPLPEPGPVGAAPKPRPFKSNMTQAAFKSAVSKAKEHICAGDAVQVVLSQRFERPLFCDPFDVYRSLRVINPSSSMYYLRIGGRHLVGSSPEVLVRVTGNQMEVRPIAGTRPRGDSPANDESLAQDLLRDEKERAEHIMLVDLGRNDLGRVAEYGSVRVNELMTVERYSHVMHLVSNVLATKRKGLSSLDVLQSCFPAGTVSGAPKVRAMQIIESLEPVRRGTYAGAVGYLSFHGDLETCIAIRTAYCQDGKVTIGAGAGIVADSVPETEYRETLNKARALFAAVEDAEKRVHTVEDVEP